MAPSFSNERAFIYARISQTDASIPKVERQGELCAALCASQQPPYEVVATFADDGISAYGNKTRPGWEELVSRLERDRVTVLVAQAEDRFTRRPEEKLALVLLCQNLGIKLHTVQEGLADPSTTDGELMIGLRGVLGRWFVSKGRTNLMQSNDLSRRAGEPKRGGIRPFGWADNRRDLHPVEGALVAQAYEDFLSGKGTRGIAADWNSSGHLPPSGKPWTGQKVRQLLEGRESNAGIVRHRGAVLDGVEGLWTPIVSRDVYEAARAKFQSRSTGQRVEPRWLCSSLANCPCGQPMRLATRNGSELSYRCATAQTGEKSKDSGVRHTSIKAELLDEIVTSEVIAAVMYMPAGRSPDPDSADLLHAHKRLGDLREAKKRLARSIARGILDEQDAAIESAQINSERDRLQQRIERIAQTNARAALVNDARAELWSGDSVSFAVAAEVKATIRHRFETVLSLEQRRSLIRETLSITVHPGRGSKRVEVTHLVAAGLNEDNCN